MSTSPTPTPTTCETCGNHYDRPLVIEHEGRRRTFDSFECAIHALAPTCERCGCRIVGHGVQAGASIYCCAHCSAAAGDGTLRDRAPAS